MKVRASSLDDLLNEVFRRLLASGKETHPRKGKAYELTGAVLELRNPRARMSRTAARSVIFSWLGELLWYLAGSDELKFIKYYLKDYKADYEGAQTVRAAYGPRLHSQDKDQLRWIVEVLLDNSHSRRAVIPIYQPKDTDSEHSEVPCTCTLQFLLRNQRLELITHMRSNDAFVGLPGDIFAFTMIQEIVARALNVELGRYKHLVGSLHLYEKNEKAARRYLAEGFQERVVMPIMPSGNPFPSLEKLLTFEQSTRLGENPKIPADLRAYWKDLALLLAIFRADKDRATAPLIRRLRKQVQSDTYIPYIEPRQRKAEQREVVPTPEPEQLPFE